MMAMPNMAPGTKAPRLVICPSCSENCWLEPPQDKSYIDEWLDLKKSHMNRGCLSTGYAKWKFNPEWDIPRSNYIKHTNKLRLVQHGNGYYTVVPADWSPEKIEIFTRATQRKQRQ